MCNIRLSAAVDYFDENPKESQNSIAIKFGNDRFKLAYKIKTQGKNLNLQNEQR